MRACNKFTEVIFKWNPQSRTLVKEQGMWYIILWTCQKREVHVLLCMDRKPQVSIQSPQSCRTGQTKKLRRKWTSPLKVHLQDLGMFTQSSWKRNRTQKPSKTGVICGREGWWGGKESQQIPDTRIDLRKENQPEKFKTEQLYFLVGSREPSALLLRVIMSWNAGLRDHSAIAFVDGSRRGDSQGHQLGHQEWLPTSTVEKSQGLFVRYNDLMCSSVSSSAKWG